MSETMHEREAMRAVLGAMVMDPGALAMALSLLRGDAMSGRPEGLVLAAMRSIAARSEPVDMLRVALELDRSGQLERVEGRHGLTVLFEYGCPLSTLEAHVRVVNGEATRSSLRLACSSVLTSLADSTVTAAELLDTAETRIASVRDRHEPVGMQSLGEVLAGMRGGAWRGTPTGYRCLDWAMGGWYPGRLISIGARPGMGKTALAVGLADKAAVAGVPVLFFSLEMDPAEIAERFVALYGIPLGKFRRGGPDADAATSLLAQRAVQVVHVSRPTVMDLRAAIRRAKPSPGLVIVDYLQLVHHAGRIDNRAEQVDQVVLGIKAMAREFKVPVIACAQLNRNVEGDRGKIRRPVLSDLRESGAIENHSDVVLFLHRPGYYDKDNSDAELLVAKNRQGPSGSNFALRFDRPHAMFIEPDREESARTRPNGGARTSAH